MKCYKCDKRGHFAKCCFKGKVRELNCSVQSERSESESGGEECRELLVGVVDAVDNGVWYETIIVNGMSLSFKLDCGADTCVMSYENYKAAVAGPRYRYI